MHVHANRCVWRLAANPSPTHPSWASCVTAAFSTDSTLCKEGASACEHDSKRHNQGRWMGHARAVHCLQRKTNIDETHPALDEMTQASPIRP
jgi:hypothetical protein